MRYVVIFEEMAGGLRDEHGGPYAGGLWVFEVKHRSRGLLAWGKALPHLQVLM